MKRLHFSAIARPCLVTALLTLAIASCGGCTVMNARLNAADVSLENRRHNQTQASTGVDFTPPSETQSVGPVVRPPPMPATMASTRATSRQAIGPDAEHAWQNPWHEPHDTDGYFVGLAISGGGSRSANFGAACMFQLQRVGILQHVDYISTVSGGSLAGAYYCTADGADWNPGNVQKRLTHSFATDMLVTVLQPWNLIAMAITSWNRSDLLAESLDRTLFTRDGRVLTFADLRADRPHLLMNATDLQSGRRFVFCNSSFDDLNSDLSRYPISYAVTATAAVPVLMHYVTLRDYSTVFREYRHLIDGGITDNLGVQTLLEVYTAQCKAAAERGLASPYPNGAIFIVLDAKTRFNAQISSRQDIGFFDTLKTALGLTSKALLARASTATLAEMIVQYSPDSLTAADLRQNILQLEKTGYLDTFDRAHRRVRIIHYSLAAVSDLGQLPFTNFSESVDDISTYFNIDSNDAYNLYVAADLLMKERFEPILRPIAAELDAAAARGAGKR